MRKKNIFSIIGCAIGTAIAAFIGFLFGKKLSAAQPEIAEDQTTDVVVDSIDYSEN